LRKGSEKEGLLEHGWCREERKLISLTTDSKNLSFHFLCGKHIRRGGTKPRVKETRRLAIRKMNEKKGKRSALTNAGGKEKGKTPIMLILPPGGSKRIIRLKSTPRCNTDCPNKGRKESSVWGTERGGAETLADPSITRKYPRTNSGKSG